ncbi:hypothetical protein FRC09_001120, partial [Ceratobasidium sp. 395]
MAYHEPSNDPSTYSGFEVSGDDQRVAQIWFPGTRRDVGEVGKFHQVSDISLLWMAGEIQAAGVELNMTYIDMIISQAAGPGLEVHDTGAREESDSQKVANFQTSMSNPSTYCHRSMWAPLAQPVPLSLLDKPRELNDVERHLWVDRWGDPLPDLENSKQLLSHGIQKTSEPLQEEPTKVEKTKLNLWKLKPVDLAGYDPNRKCYANTRTNIIDELVNWAQNSNVGSRLAWVHGPAGFGKSSIATSVCLRLDGQNALASSFFCKRDIPELRDPRRVLTTISYGLALRWEAYRAAVVDIIDKDWELHSKHIQPLYVLLVKNPLKYLDEAGRPTNTLVIVIDALDECGDIVTRRHLLTCLRGMLRLEPQLRLIVTSRPDQDIQDFFGSMGANLCTKYDLLQVEYGAQADIRILINDHLSDVTPADGWPSNAVDELSLRSNGLFVWAVTACRFILGGFDQTKRLNQILASMQTDNVSVDLDILYATVVENSAPDDASDNMKYITNCLGAVIVTAAHTPLSIPNLAQLLGERIPDQILNRTLESLSSVLYVDQKQGNVVRVLHHSFMDYITDSSRSKDLCVDLKRQNTILAECCLEVMNKDLKFNICGLETSHLLNTQVQNLDGRVQNTIRPHLSYSCLYWSSHVADGNIDALEAHLRQFLFQIPLVYWIEALSLLGKLGTAISSLLQFTGCSIPDYMCDCLMVANDAYKFILSFYDAISKSTPHLYISALAFAPSNSGIARRMRPLFSKLLTVVRDAEAEWTPCLSSIRVDDPVLAVSVSPNGHRIVSGSKGGKVQVWDVETGDVVLTPLKYHLNQVNCVAFSPDDRWIASNSPGNTICVWNAETGEARLDLLKGHTAGVTSVAFSPDGHRLVSVSRDDTVRVWELETGQAVLVLHEYSAYWVIQSVAFSPDGRWIVSGLPDKTLRIWDAQTGESALRPLHGHGDKLLSVAFSPDGHRIVSGSADRTIRIWDTKTGNMLLRALQGHLNEVTCVAFSPDGCRIVSGSNDYTVRIWDAQTGDPVTQPLAGHSGRVTSVSFCLNGRVVSGSTDKTIRIWDVVDGGEVKPSKPSKASGGHTDKVNSVAFSPEGRLVVSGSEDKTVRIWDAETGELVQGPLGGHSSAVTAVAVSSNGRWIASGSKDRTVCIWDAATGKPTLELQGHSGPVLSVAFSPDCRLIVSGSWDKTVRIWDVETGQAVLEPPKGHEYSTAVTSVAFSPDGHRIASSSKDGVCIWDSRTFQVIARTPETELSFVNSVAFSPDGRRVVCGASNKKTLSVLDAATGDTILSSPEGYDASIQSAAFSPDGRWIASAPSFAGMIRIWDAQTGQSVEPLEQGFAINSVAFSPDGCRIVFGYSGGSIYIWDIDPGTLPYVASPRCLPGTELPILLTDEADDRVSVAINQLARHVHSELAGCVISTTGELLFWLPRELQDINALLCIPSRVRSRRVMIDFTEFVHGSSWSSIYD